MMKTLKNFVNFLLFEEFGETEEEEDLRLLKRHEDAQNHRDRLYFYPQSFGLPLASYDEIFN